MPASKAPHTDSGIHKAVVPAAGLGTRLRPLTFAYPKELLPIGRKPVLGHIASELQAAGIEQILVVVSDRKPQIRNFLGDFYRDEMVAGPGFRCSYVVQDEQRGLGDALLRAEDWVAGNPFAVAFGDCMIEAPDSAEPLRRLITTHAIRGASATVLCEKVSWDAVSRYGILEPAGEYTKDIDDRSDHANGESEDPRTTDSDIAFEVEHIVEKPARDAAPSNLAVAARWVLDASIFRYLKRAAMDPRGELNLTDSVEDMTREGGSLWASPLRFNEYRRDIGNFDTFFSAFIRAALADPESGEAARNAARDTLAALDVS